MKMTRRDFLKLSSAAAAACGVTLLPAQKADAASAIQTLLERSLSLRLPAGARGRHQRPSPPTRRPLPPAAPPSTSSSTPGSCWTLPAHGRQTNVDTIYTQAWLDVSAEPQNHPSMRRPTAFSACQVLDAWTGYCRRAGAPGPTPSPTRAGRARCPRASGIDIPTGRSGPSPASCSPGRTTCRSMAALQGRMQLMPLSAYPAGLAPLRRRGSYSPENDFVPVQKVLAMTPQEFFDTANRLMERRDPPAGADAPLLRSLAAPLPSAQASSSTPPPSGNLSAGCAGSGCSFSSRAASGHRQHAIPARWASGYYGDPIGNFGTATTTGRWSP